MRLHTQAHARTQTHLQCLLSMMPARRGCRTGLSFGCLCARKGAHQQKQPQSVRTVRATWAHELPMLTHGLSSSLTHSLMGLCESHEPSQQTTKSLQGQSVCATCGSTRWEGKQRWSACAP